MQGEECSRRSARGGVHGEECSRRSVQGVVLEECMGGVDMKVPKQCEKDIFRDWRSVGEMGISTEGA